MADLRPLQASFSAGEVTPLIDARIDLGGYGSGCRTMRNMFARAQGPASSRGGMLHTATLRTQNTLAKAFTLHIRADLQFIVVCYSDGQTGVYNLAGIGSLFATPWTGNEVESIQAAEAPAQGNNAHTLYLVQENHPPHKVVHNNVTFQNTVSQVSFTSQPGEWAANNYPGAIAFYQSRLWLAGTPEQPEQLWASQVGTANFENFTTGTDADDSLDFSLSAKGRIVWMQGLARNLVVGTEFAEHIITGGADRAITPSNIDADEQSSFGSKNRQAQKLGDRALYISPDGRKLRSINYDWTIEQFASLDVTFFSEHITKGRLIDEVVFAQNPLNVLWMKTSDGNFLGCTYERSNNLIGWHRHETDGDVRSITVVQNQGVSLVYAVVTRQVDNGLGTLVTETRLEELITPESPTTGVPMYMDSAVRVFIGPPTETLTGLTTLAGIECGLVVDDAFVGLYTVSSTGELDVGHPISGANVFVGRVYTVELETNPIDLVQASQTTAIGSKTWKNLYLRLFESQVPTINDEPPVVRSPSTFMGEGQPLIERKDVKVHPVGHDRQMTVRAVSEVPLQLQVLGVFGNMDVAA